MKKQLSVSFNRYCVECKKQKSTHCAVLLGIYVCAACTTELIKVYGGNKEVVCKSLLGEQWDDY